MRTKACQAAVREIQTADAWPCKEAPLTPFGSRPGRASIAPPPKPDDEAPNPAVGAGVPKGPGVGVEPKAGVLADPKPPNGIVDDEPKAPV